MIILVCGGRRFSNGILMDRILSGLSIRCLIEGGAEGADKLARKWAERRGVHYAEVPALWDYYKKRAGPMRNKTMLLLQPQLVVAFPGGDGTAGMIRLARRAKVDVLLISEDGTWTRI